MSHERRIVEEFTHQSEHFNVAPVYTAAETLDALIAIMPLEADAFCLELACGPGIVSRAMAPRAGRVLGLDLTPAMVDLAKREAARLGLQNLDFAVDDATALSLASGTADGAVTRFSLHHVPRPGRVVAEMARVVRPGGWVCVGDHLAAGSVDDVAWHQEIERLRDPSHWACLTAEQLLALGRGAGLRLVEEVRLDFSLDFDEWLNRGSGGPAMRPLIERALAERPDGAPSFRVRPDGAGGRRLHLVHHVTLWRAPAT